MLKIDIKGIDTDRLVIFDLDDTLVTSEAKIKLVDRHTGKVIKEMTPQEFNEFDQRFQKKRHVLNYDDFSDPEILRQGEFIHWVFNKFKSYYSRKIPVAIVTARSSSSLIRNFFLEKGIDIHPQLVIAVNDMQYGYTGSIAERKKQAIKDLIDLGFKNLTFFDDSKENLQLAKEVEGYEGAKIKLVHVE